MNKGETAQLSWKKKLFSNQFRIYQNQESIGSLIQKWLSQDAEGKLGNEVVYFEGSGLFSQHVNILGENKSPIGSLKYNFWKTEATLELSHQTYQCKMKGFFSYSLSIMTEKEGRELYKFKGDDSKGTIDRLAEANNHLLLCGLYLMNYYVETIVSSALIVFFIIYL